MSGRPDASEYDSAYDAYIREIEGNDILTILDDQLAELTSLFDSIPAEREAYRYAEGKWSFRQLVGHMADSERVFGYRATSLARGDAGPYPGFDENLYVDNAPFDDTPLPMLLEELELLRSANMLMFHALTAEGWSRSGTANGRKVTVRALAYIIAGHAAHHIRVIRERYLSE
jgi:hypothetical protein